MYLHIGLGTLSSPPNSIRESGRLLVDECLGGIDPERHPVRLFVLWVTQSFQPFNQLLDGIHEELAQKSREPGFAALNEVPLIGASVAACMFEEDVHPNGALLLCFASRFMQAKAGVGERAQDNPASGVANLLQALNLTDKDRLNPRRNRFLMAFIPGFREGGKSEQYRAFEIADELAKQTNDEIKMFGGVASAGFPRGHGSQFLGRHVYTESVVAANISSDLTYGIGLNDGLVGRV